MAIRFAVIGSGNITHSFLDAAQQDSRFVLQAVYSRNLTTAKQLAQQYHANLVFDDLELLATCEQVDAVYIASPNSLHAQQSMQMMRMGKHVLCEKPVAANVNELEQMISSAKQHNVCFMEAMLSSFVPNFLQIKKALPRIGAIRKMQASFCQLSSRYPRFLAGEATNTFDANFANGALMDIGIYPLYAAISLFGMPDNMLSAGTKLSSGVDGCGELLLDYQGDRQGVHQIQASISYSKISNGDNIGEIQGELARITWHHSSVFNTAELIFNNGDREDLSVAQVDNRMVYEVNHFIDLIESGQQQSSLNTWQLSKNVLSVIEQCRLQQGIIYPSDHR